ncbi:MAG: DMT family transporter [Kofleriaceae bacterium]
MTPGLWFMVAAALAFSGMSVLVKLASQTLPSAEVVLARAAVTLVLSSILVARLARTQAVSPWGRRRAALISRGAFGFFALGCYYWTLGQMPLAEATMIQQSSPIWGAVLAWVWLREPVGATTAVALAIGFVGVSLVAQPSGHGVARWRWRSRCWARSARRRPTSPCGSWPPPSTRW